MPIHILGNGPSINLFDRNEWPDSDLFVGCNFSDPALRPDYTVIVDIRPMKKFRGGSEAAYKLGIPAVLTDRANKYIEDTRGGWDRIPKGLIHVHEVIPLIRDRSITKSLAMNSAQHGVMHFVGKYPDVCEGMVHIWGCDSFWTDDIRSNTDKIIGKKKTPDGSRKKPGIVSPWRKYWYKIFGEYDNVSFNIHAPADQAKAAKSWESVRTHNVEVIYHVNSSGTPSG